MKVTFLNKSDIRGGAAVVTLRLVEELRRQGVDARLLVVEKLSERPEVQTAAPAWRAKIPFLEERLGIYLANGRNRADLFKVDTASHGLPLWRHPWVKDADIVALNWINQGMLSLKGIDAIAAMGKPLVWTMHDMWCMTGICHHAGDCRGWHGSCGDCPFLGDKAAPDDLSASVWKKKYRLFGKRRIRFVAVSNWLAERARRSRLLQDADLRVIPNAFPLRGEACVEKPDGKTGIVFGAARLDDPVKGLPILIKALGMLPPELRGSMRLETFGGVRDASLLDNLPLEHRHHGVVKGEEAIREIYRRNHIVVSASLYETLPGTLVEGQAYGCVPVAFDRGGQRDIVAHGHTGYLAVLPDVVKGTDVFALADSEVEAAAAELAAGLQWSAEHQSADMRQAMWRSVDLRFSASHVAAKYLDLFTELQ